VRWYYARGRRQIRQARGGANRHPKQNLHFLDRQRHPAPPVEQNADARGAPRGLPRVPGPQADDDMASGIQAAPG